jgi:hypothetical protein
MHVPDAEYWRLRAEEMRALAEDMKGRHCKEIAVRIANDYDRLAFNAEQQETSTRV